MAINNFVNFITDTITPPIIDSYPGGISCPDFCGSDSSTADYTKLGWVFKCYMEMKEQNLVDSEVTRVTQAIADVNDIPTLRSQTGFNILQVLCYEKRGDKEFSIANNLDGISQSEILSLALVADNPGGQTAFHMAVDYGLKELVDEIGIENSGHIDDPGRVGDFLSPWALAIVKAGEEATSDSSYTYRRELASLIAPAAAGKGYNEFMGPNPLYSGSGGKLVNEISRVIMSTSHDVLENTIDDLITTLPASGGILTTAAVEVAEGISPGSVKFNVGAYTAQESERGYHPLYFYLHKYRSSVKKDILDKLEDKFSPVSISVTETGDTEGFTAVSMAANYLSLDGAGGWNNPELGTWVKDVLGRCGNSANSIWASSGSVRVFTSGSSSNAFGPITNILVKINDDHAEWWSNQPDDTTLTVHDYESTFSSLASQVLPGEINYDFYRTWMVEFGKEIG